MRIGFVSTRLAGTDGVSLETRKIAHILTSLGHSCYYCAGELDPDFPGLIDPLFHFMHPDVAGDSGTGLWRLDTRSGATGRN